MARLRQMTASNGALGGDEMVESILEEDEDQDLEADDESGSEEEKTGAIWIYVS